MSENQKLFALLIDGDNVQPTHIPQMLDKLSEYGEPRISKVFHNKTTIEQWEQIASKHSIEPIWVPNNVKQKNSVDIALVMDAMIFRYERPEITGFCIVASDGDYTRLARYLKSQGKFVLGIGEQKTPEPFRNACTEFIYIDNEAITVIASKQSVTAAEKLPAPIIEISDNVFKKLFLKAHRGIIHTGVQDKQGRVTLREVWEKLKEIDPEFSSREYRQMPKFVNRVKNLAQIYPDIITLEEQQDSKPTAHYVYIKSVNDKPVSNEIARFRAAYKHAKEVLKLKDEDQWVKLSVIGDALRELYPDYQPLIYRDIRHKQLKKVVEKMMVDYPGVIELNANSQHPQMRIKTKK